MQPHSLRDERRTTSLGSKKGAPESIEWRRQPPLRRRLIRAIAAPTAAAFIVFAGVLVVSITMVFARPHAPAPDPEGVTLGEPAEGLGGTQGAQLADVASDSAAEATLHVHVVGEVAAPGVVRLEAGARVADAIEAAGGATEAAVLSGVNLARLVNDGEQILVPDVEALGAPQPGSVRQEAAAVNINTADAATLETLPGVGPALAARIVSWRERYGWFTSVDQLLEVSGIGVKKLEQLRANAAV